LLQTTASAGNAYKIEPNQPPLFQQYKTKLPKAHTKDSMAIEEKLHY